MQRDPGRDPHRPPGPTFFNCEFPGNTFHLRRPLLEPLPGTLPEAEIWARLVRALDVVDDAALAYGRAFAQASAERPEPAALAPYVLYETLGRALPAGLRAAARCGSRRSGAS